MTGLSFDPESYEGGALVVGDEHDSWDPAGDLVVYPATTIHRVSQVTRGKRLAAVFWVQSLIRSREQRDLLITLSGIQASLGESLASASRCRACSRTLCACGPSNRARG